MHRGSSDTTLGIVDWPDDYFITIAKEYLKSGGRRAAMVGAAQSYLFDATELNRFGVQWMEAHFSNKVHDNDFVQGERMVREHWPIGLLREAEGNVDEASSHVLSSTRTRTSSP